MRKVRSTAVRRSSGASSSGKAVRMPIMPSSEEVPGHHPEHVAGMLRQLADHRGLEAGVHGAVAAEQVLTRLPILPVGPVPELAPRLGPGLADQVARSLPALRRVGD